MQDIDGDAMRWARGAMMSEIVACVGSWRDNEWARAPFSRSRRGAPLLDGRRQRRGGEEGRVIRPRLVISSRLPRRYPTGLCCASTLCPDARPLKITNKGPERQPAPPTMI